MEQADIQSLLRELRLPTDVLRSDKHALDDEFEAHPNHMMTVSAALADARLDRDQQKALVLRIEGNVRREHRMQAGDRRVTEKEATVAVSTDPEVRAAERDLMQKEHRVDVLFGLVNALQAKTSALKHLSELYQAGYYVTSSGRPRARRDREER